MKALGWKSPVIMIASISLIPCVFAQRLETEEKYSVLTDAQLSSLRSAVLKAFSTAVLQDELLKRRLLREYQNKRKKKNDQGHVDGVFLIHMNANGFVESVLCLEVMDNRSLEKEISLRLQHYPTLVSRKYAESSLKLTVDEIIDVALTMPVRSKQAKIMISPNDCPDIQAKEK